MNEITTVGIDLAKHVFRLRGVDSAGRVVLRKTVRRDQLEAAIAALPTCLIGMEACSGANEWARRFTRHGHRIKLIAPKFVAPYRIGGKTRLGRITRRGDAYLRTLLVMGARSVLNTAHRHHDRMARFATAIQSRHGYFKALLAVTRRPVLQDFPATILTPMRSARTSNSAPVSRSASAIESTGAYRRGNPD